MKFIASILLLFVFSFAQSQNVFNKNLETAKIENKYVFLYFSGSDWCGPCIKFKKFIVNTTEFQTYAESNLIVYNADFPRLSKNKLPKEIEKENEFLADKYNSDGIFPLILVLDSDGKVIKKWEEFPKETLEEFIVKLKK